MIGAYAIAEQPVAYSPAPAGGVVTPPADNTVPTISGTLAYTKTATSITIDWSGTTSSDNVGIEGRQYRIGGSGAYIPATGGEESSQVHTFFGLSASTTYQIDLRCVDTSGLASDPLTISVQTDAVVVDPGNPTPDAPRFGRPVIDVSKGAWTASTGTDLYAVLDEVTPDATDYISTSTPSSCEVALGPITDPGTSAGQVVRYESHSPGGGNLTVTLKQGMTTIASRTHASLPTVATIHELVLTGPQCDAITNYRDLRLVFTVN